MDLKELLEELEIDSQLVTKTIQNIITEHTSKLNRLILDIDNTLKQVRDGKIQEYPINKLELDFTQLTIEIYKVNNIVAELGGTSDIAKSKREIAFSKAYLQAKGNTIKEKEALAMVEIENEIVIEQIYKRVIQQLKLITDNADNIHMALKRMHKARLTEMEVFRRE